MSVGGSAGTSMRQLAGACGLNVAAIYHYFDSKDALLAAVVEERQYGARFAGVPTLDPTDPPEERLRQMFTNMWEGALAEEAVWRLLLGEAIRGEAGVIPVGKGLLEVFQPGLSGWITEGLPELGDPGSAASIMIGQMFWGFIRHVFDPAVSTDEICSDAVAALRSTLDLGGQQP